MSVDVTVVTPCLNPGSRLKRCIESVRAQTFDSVEHIVIDGGSTDGTVEFLEKQEDIVWVSEQDDGQSSAINKGFAMAKGRFIGWLNADDALAPDAIDLTVSLLGRRPVDWTYGDNLLFGTNREVMRKPPKRLKRSVLNRGNPIPQAGAFMTRRALDRVGYLDESLHYVMDLDLWIRLLDAGFAPGYVDSTVARVEIHDSSKSGSTGSAGRFISECAEVWARHGDLTAAAVARGRVAAHSFAGEPSVDRREALRRAVKDASSLVADGGANRGLCRALAAGVSAEAVRVEHSNGIKRFRHLFTIDPWTVPHTRQQLLRSFARKLTGARFPRAE